MPESTHSLFPQLVAPPISLNRYCRFLPNLQFLPSPPPQFDFPSPTAFRGACAPLGQITSLLRSEPSTAPTLFFFFCSAAKSHPTLCDRMDCSTPGFPVLHYSPELAQTRVHGVGDAIQPSHPLSPPSPAAFNLSQHQGLF